jgi:hypothetical protein
MKQTYRFAVAGLALICLLWVAPAVAAKEYGAERFDVVLDVQPDGSLEVTETVRFRFEGGPFTYAFRDLAYSQLDEIDRLQASMDGAVLPQGTGPGQVEVEAGRPLKVTWHFAPTSDAAHEFVLTYRVQGAIRQEEGSDSLIWRAIPEDHDYEVERSTITLRYPASIALLGAKLSGAAAVQEAGDGRVEWTTAGIDEDESLVVTARFPPGSLVETAPDWQSRAAERRQQATRALPAGLAACVVTLVAGLAWLKAAMARERRTSVAGRGRPAPLSTPPPDLWAQTPPGLAVRLAGGGNPALATIFDLAGRGLLSVQETGQSRWTGKQYRLDRLPAGAELRPHEAGLLRALFTEKSGEGDSLPLSDVARRLSSRGKWYKEPLEQETEAGGWLDPRREGVRNRLLGRGLVVLLVGLAVAVAGLVLAAVSVGRGAETGVAAPAVAAGVGTGLFLFGMIAMITGGGFSPLTEAGEQAAYAWKGFAAYLKEIVRGREFVAGGELFERYLPFAAGFGLGERWAKHFQKQGYASVPGWFQALAADGGDFGGVVAVMAATDASFSSAAGAAAGAAGASGGGASGAG